MGREKAEALEMIQRLPDEATTADILDELYFKQAVDEGLRDVVRGRVISHEELRVRIERWRDSVGR